MTRRRPARCLDKAVDKAKHEVAGTKKLAKAIRIRSKLYPREGDNYTEGLSAGLEMAADFLEGGNW